MARHDVALGMARQLMATGARVIDREPQAKRDFVRELRVAGQAIKDAPNDEARRYAGEAYNAIVDQICPKCYGEGVLVSGKRAERDCPNCGGTGEVSK